MVDWFNRDHVITLLALHISALTDEEHSPDECWELPAVRLFSDRYGIDKHEVLTRYREINDAHFKMGDKEYITAYLPRIYK